MTDDPGSLLTAFQIEVAQMFLACRRAAGSCSPGEGPCWRKA